MSASRPTINNSVLQQWVAATEMQCGIRYYKQTFVFSAKNSWQWDKWPAISWFKTFLIPEPHNEHLDNLKYLHTKDDICTHFALLWGTIVRTFVMELIWQVLTYRVSLSRVVKSPNLDRWLLVTAHIFEELDFDLIGWCPASILAPVNNRRSCVVSLLSQLLDCCNLMSGHILNNSSTSFIYQPNTIDFKHSSSL